MSIESGVFIPGGKTGVLVLHELGASADDLRPLARHLSQCGYTVAMPQLARNGGAETASALIGQAEASLARLKERCSDLVVIGVSYGSMLALEVARQNTATVQAVMMVEPRAWLPGVRLPFATHLSGHVRQAWIAQLAGKIGTLAARLSAPTKGAQPQAGHQILGLSAAVAPARPLSGGLSVGAGQILDCLHATLPAIRQPVLVLRRQDAPKSVIDTSILLQRRLGGRVETGVLDQSHYAEAGADRHQEGVAERASRFIAALMDELTTRRDNEMRRQRTGANRSNAA